jgi:hypothetical protein
MRRRWFAIVSRSAWSAAVALAIESLFQALPSMSETTPPASVTSRLPAATWIADVQNRT